MAEDINLIFEKYLEVIEEAGKGHKPQSYGDVMLGKQHTQKGALAFGLGQKEAENFYSGNTGLTPEITKQYRSDKTYEQIIGEELNDPEKHIVVTGSEGIVSPKSQKTFLAMRARKELDRYLNISDTEDILIPHFSLAQTINNFSLHARNSDDENVKKAIAEFLSKTLIYTLVYILELRQCSL
jgi:hypothetical protein